MPELAETPESSRMEPFLQAERETSLSSSLDGEPSPYKPHDQLSPPQFVILLRPIQRLLRQMQHLPVETTGKCPLSEATANLSKSLYKRRRQQ